jgi:hypothetical protein
MRSRQRARASEGLAVSARSIIYRSKGMGLEWEVLALYNGDGW